MGRRSKTHKKVAYIRFEEFRYSIEEAKALSKQEIQPFYSVNFTKHNNNKTSETNQNIKLGDMDDWDTVIETCEGWEDTNFLSSMQSDFYTDLFEENEIKSIWN